MSALTKPRPKRTGSQRQDGGSGNHGNKRFRAFRLNEATLPDLGRLKVTVPKRTIRRAAAAERARDRSDQRGWLASRILEGPTQ